MTPLNLKKMGAKAALNYIKSGDVIGLGGGRTIAYLIEYLKEEQIQVEIVTPSIKTRNLCLEHGFVVRRIDTCEKISVAFDGCDEVDQNLYALKSGGGIHTLEKLIASMATHYILLVDESKVSSTLTFKQPISLEIIKESLASVKRKVRELGGLTSVRVSEEKDGYTITDHGNLLLDVTLDTGGNIDIKNLNKTLKSIVGVVETSLFTEHVTLAIVATQANNINKIQLNEENC